MLNQRIRPEQFLLDTNGEMRLSDEARTEFIHAIEAKLNASTGKGKGSIDYRRTIAVQAYQLRSVILGESSTYMPYRPR